MPEECSRPEETKSDVFSDSARNQPGSERLVPLRTSSDGWRDGEHVRKPGARAVLLLGDSYTFGFGLERTERFGDRLQGLLDEYSSERWQVFNTGVSGWGTRIQTTFATDHLAAYDPVVIVLTFCLNDASDDLRFRYNVGNFSRPLWSFPLAAELARVSHLYRFVVERRTSTVLRNRLEMALAADPTTDLTLPESDPLNRLRRGSGSKPCR